MAAAFPEDNVNFRRPCAWPAPLAVLAVLAMSPAPLHAQSGESDLARGARVFTRVCAPCHGEGPGTDGAAQLPGTAALGARYQGRVPAALERRDDLSFEFLREVVRHGVGAMPMFRATEVSDRDLEAIARYLKDAAGRHAP